MDELEARPPPIKQGVVWKKQPLDEKAHVSLKVDIEGYFQEVDAFTQQQPLGEPWEHISERIDDHISTAVHRALKPPATPQHMPKHQDFRVVLEQRISIGFLERM